MSEEPSIASSPSLHIAVIGVGGIGSTFALQLARVGHHSVTVVARPGSLRLQQLQRDTGIVDIKGTHANVRVLDTLDEQTSYDLVIVTVLAHQVSTLLPGLNRSAARCVQFMFNNFEPDRLQKEVGVERCAFGMPFIQAALDKDGKLKAVIGSGGQKTKMDRQRWVDVFIAAGLPAVLEPNMLLWLRCHVPLCVSFESISVASVRRGGGASWGESMVVARGMQEGFLLVQRLGYPLYPWGKSRLNSSPAWVVAGMLWFVSRIPSFRDLLATGENECRALVDVLISTATRVDPPVAVARIQAIRPSDKSDT